MPGRPRRRRGRRWRASLVRDAGTPGRAPRSPTSPLADDEATRDRDPRRGSARTRTPVSVVEPSPPTARRVTVVSRDRVGLLADAAAMLALQRVLGARGPGLDAGRVRRLGLGRRRDGLDDMPCCASGSTRSSTAASTRPTGCAGRSPSELEPTVVVRPEASRAGDGLEVRAADRPGRGPPRLRGARPARHRRAVGARRHAGPAGRGRVLRPGGRGRRALARSARRRRPTPYARH